MTSIRSYAQQNTNYLYTLFCHLFDEYSLSTCFFWYWSTCSKYNCDPYAHKYMFSFILYFTERQTINMKYIMKWWILQTEINKIRTWYIEIKILNEVGEYVIQLRLPQQNIIDCGLNNRNVFFSQFWSQKFEITVSAQSGCGECSDLQMAALSVDS